MPNSQRVVCLIHIIEQQWLDWGANYKYKDFLWLPIRIVDFCRPINRIITYFADHLFKKTMETIFYISDCAEFTTSCLSDSYCWAIADRTSRCLHCNLGLKSKAGTVIKSLQGLLPGSSDTWMALNDFPTFPKVRIPMCIWKNHTFILSTFKVYNI